MNTNIHDWGSFKREDGGGHLLQQHNSWCDVSEKHRRSWKCKLKNTRMHVGGGELKESAIAQHEPPPPNLCVRRLQENF